MNEKELDDILNTSLYSLDYGSLITGVSDFIEFSESNLLWQRRRETKKVEEEACAINFKPEEQQYRDQYIMQAINAVEYKFDVTLAQNIRYSGLVSLLTAFEWCAKSLISRVLVDAPKKAPGENIQIHVLSWLNKESGAGYDEDVNVFRNLIRIRNCIIHSSGLVLGYEHEKEIRGIIRNLDGFSILKNNFIGESIHISEVALLKYIEQANNWLVKFDIPCIRAGLLK